MKVLFIFFALVIFIFSGCQDPALEGKNSVLLDHAVINVEPQQEVKESYPPSPIEGTYAYSSSGIPIEINLAYKDSPDDHYNVIATFTAGQYWYKFLWDYGPTHIKEVRYKIRNINSGQIYTTDFQIIMDGLWFYGNGRARYASCTIPKLSFARITLPKDWVVIGVDVKGYEGRMAVGPTGPMSGGQSDLEIWHWDTRPRSRLRK